jgi:hypothetical protein
MTVVTQLLAAVGTFTAVVLILLMAAVPLLLDLPLRPAPDVDPSMSCRSAPQWSKALIHRWSDCRKGR